MVDFETGKIVMVDFELTLKITEEETEVALLY